MFIHQRPVRFADCDMARIVFFPHFAAYCHEALEALFAGLPGGYARLVGPDDLGIPTVHFSIEFAAPLRYGDTAVIALEVERLGRTSVSIRYRFSRAVDQVVCARARHTIVTTSLRALKPVPVPADLRQLFESHLIGEDAGHHAPGA